MKCFDCGKESEISLPYTRRDYCKKHFNEFIEERFLKAIEKQKMFKAGDRLAIAFSGGKDSTALLCLMRKHYSKTNKLHAIMIDEGYKGYRDESIKIGLKHLKKLGIPFTIKSFKEEFGFQMQDKLPEIRQKKLGQSCSVCGTLRRALLNETALGLKADRLLTGHNLDDECQSIAMNFFQNDFNRMLKLRPVENEFLKEGFVKRAKPFYAIPETELQAYCLLNKLKHYSSDCCPASHSVKRRFYKNKLNEFEARFPGTKQSILNFFEGLLPLIKEKGKTGKQACVECGQPSTGRQCRKCMFLKKLSG